MVRPTGLHKFYSDDRRDWADTEELEVGERLRSIDGWLTVKSLVKQPGVHRVYNMTVAGEHVYHVSSLGLLSHNVKGACGPTKAKTKSSGSYTIEFSKGMKYHGKGPKSRMEASAKRISKEYGVKAINKNWTSAKNAHEAFKQEARRIRADGGIGNPKNYNKINSPGEKYLPPPPR
jgi:hypothetical protein